jgi:WD40 repeat protein
MKVELKKTGRFSFPMGVLDFAVRQDESSLYAACLDGIYGLSLPPRDAHDDKPVPDLLGRHESYVSGIMFQPEEKGLVTTGFDGSLHIRPLTPAAKQEIAPSFQQRVHSFWSWKSASAPDKTRVASVTGQYLTGAEDYAPLASDEPTVKIFDALTGATLKSFNLLPPVQCVAFDAKGEYVAAGNLMGDVAVWKVESGEEVARWRTTSFTSWGIIKSHCYISGLFAISFAPDSKSLYVAGMGDMRDPMAGNGKQLWQRFSLQESPGTKIQESVGDQTGEGLMETLAWHPSGKYFAMGGRLRGGNWNLGLFDVEKGELIGQAKTGMRITTVRFSDDGKVLFLGGMQGQPGMKEGKFPDFGYIERFEVIES